MRAGALGGLHDRLFLDRGDTGRDSDDHARAEAPRAPVNLLDEVGQHRFGDAEV